MHVCAHNKHHGQMNGWIRKIHNLYVCGGCRSDGSWLCMMMMGSVSKRFQKWWTDMCLALFNECNSKESTIFIHGACHRAGTAQWVWVHNSDMLILDWIHNWLSARKYNVTKMAPLRFSKVIIIITLQMWIFQDDCILSGWLAGWNKRYRCA